MSSRLTSRSDTPTKRPADRVSDRLSPAQNARASKAKIRLDRAPKRPDPQPAATPDAGVTMSYQQGFTSGPSI